MPPRPSRGPTSLHLASLGSPFALLTDPPPPRFTSLPSRRILSWLYSPYATSSCSSSSSSSQPLHAALLALPREHERDSAVMPLPSSSFYPTAASSPSLSAAPLARASTSPTLPPFSSCSCSLFLLGRPHRAFSSTVRVREHGERLFVSYRLVSLDSLLSLLLPH